MWRRWIRDLSVELYWLKRDIIRRWGLDTPIGAVGILTLISGIMLIIIIGEGIAQIFRSFTPWVSGSRIGEVYWQSVGFGIKTSIVFLLFIVSVIIFVILQFFKRQ